MARALGPYLSILTSLFNLLLLDFCFSLDTFTIRQPTRRYKLTGHSDRVAASAWSPFTVDDPQTRLLVTASYDTSCIVWNVLEQRPLKRFYGHRSLIYAIRWSHFAPELIFTGGEDCFHCWDWTQQPDYDPKVGAFLGKSLVSVQSLKKKAVAGSIDAKDQPKDTATTSAKEPKIKSTASTISTQSNQTSTVSSATITSKPLFAVSNQIENNSSKYDVLDDIKWIAKLRAHAPPTVVDPESSSQKDDEFETVSEKKLTRILLYRPSAEDAQKFLSVELENHLKSNQADAAEMVSMLVDLRGAIQKAVDQEEADFILASLAMPISRELYKKCIEIHWKTSATSTG